MANTFNDCDKFVMKALMNHGCQTSYQLHTYGNRMYNEDHPVRAISASLRKFVAKGMAASSPNEKNQKVYWLTEFGKMEGEA